MGNEYYFCTAAALAVDEASGLSADFAPFAVHIYRWRKL